jgi:hypothetical protein
MPRNLEIFRWPDHPVGSWRDIAVACCTVADIASVAVLLNRCTLTARVLIEPHAGSYPRGAAAGSSINLEQLKRSVRNATIPRNITVLKSFATLHEPTPARDLTLYITEQTVRPVCDGAAEVLEQTVAPHTVAQLGCRGSQ